MFSSLNNDIEMPLPQGKKGKGGGKPPKGTKKKYRLFDFPNDCIGVILTFCKNVSILKNFLLLSKNTKNFVESNAEYAQNISYLMKTPPKTPKPYVYKLAVYKKGEETKGIDKLPSHLQGNGFGKHFPNVRKLDLRDIDFFGDEVLNGMDNLTVLKLDCCNKFTTKGFEKLSNLKTLILDNNRYTYYWNTYKLKGMILKHLPKLTRLEIHGYYDFCTGEDLSAIKNVEIFRASGMSISTKMLKEWKNLHTFELKGCDGLQAKRFKYCTNLKILKLISCRRIYEQDVKKYLDPLPEDYEFESPRPRRGKMKRPKSISDSDEEISV